ncbi:MAG: type II toxin-antitoxin system VapC family toxin [Jatrophihabitantaceae bacterium]
MIVLDASVLIAQLNPDDAHHGSAVELLAEAAAETLVAHRLTLAEVLVGGARAGRAAEMLSDLRAIGVAPAPQSAGEDEALRLADLRAGTGIKLPDCCVLDVALENDAELATFDRALAEVARHRGVVVRG